MPSLWGSMGHPEGWETPSLKDGGSRQDMWEPVCRVLLLLCMLGIIFLLTGLLL